MGVEQVIVLDERCTEFPSLHCNQRRRAFLSNESVNYESDEEIIHHSKMPRMTVCRTEQNIMSQHNLSDLSHG